MELWDAYDEKLNKIEGMTLVRGEEYQAVFLGQKGALEPFVYSENDEMSKISLWDMKEDIGYVDELDVAIVKAIETQS